MKHFKQIVPAGWFSLLFAFNAMASSTVSNGDFSAGLSGWSTLGDVSVQVGAAFLTSASLGEDDYPASASAFNFSGTAAATVGVVGGVEEFSGLAIGDLDPDINNDVAAYEGSALKQTLSVHVGQVLKFDWQFFTNESAGGQDYAYVAINGVKTVLASPLNAATNSSPFSRETALSTFYYTFTGTGPATIAFGVVDVNDFNVSSALRLDNVQAVPLPGAAWLFGPALLAVVRRNRRKFETVCYVLP